MTAVEINNTDGGQIVHASLEHLISIWPISSSIAACLPAGDLISLSRTSVTLRLLTHDFSKLPAPDSSRSSFSGPHVASSSRERAECLQIGNHQTAYWAGLKSLAPFVCSFPYHKDPKSGGSSPCRACKFCSRPICRTCIVRSFFTNPRSSKDTYKYRARHLCPACWSSGNLRKDFRFPSDAVSREQVWMGRDYAYRGNWCACSASEDNWVCGECRTLQNATGSSNLAPSEASCSPTGCRGEAEGRTPTLVRCYGLDCENTIDEVDRDKRRICLWCSKPLMRHYGGEDRLRWEEKQIEIRAAAAASRSADIEEWARNRFQSLTMSRREMRGTDACVELTGSDGPEHDRRMFVRHLDTINYRKYMAEKAAPSPDSVYQSKHGRWTYSRDFMQRVARSIYFANLTPPSSISGAELFALTRQDGLRGARRNIDMKRYRGSHFDFRIATYAAQLKEAGLIDQKALDWLYATPTQHGKQVRTLGDSLLTFLGVWENKSHEDREHWCPPSFWALAAAAGLEKGDIEIGGGGGGGSESGSGKGKGIPRDDPANNFEVAEPGSSLFVGGGGIATDGETPHDGHWVEIKEDGTSRARGELDDSTHASKRHKMDMKIKTDSEPDDETVWSENDDVDDDMLRGGNPTTA